MARYIDADKLIADGWHLERSAPSGKILSMMSIADVPTADVEEVKRGEWELKFEIRRFLEEIDEDFYVECPFCHRDYYVPFEFEDEKMLEYARKHYPYCNCGAKMDGERKQKNDFKEN